MPNWKKVIVSGSQAHLAAVTASSQITVNPVADSTEAALVLGPGPAGGSGEGGQIALQPASGFTSGSFIDMYQTGAEPYWRVLRGTAASSDALLMQLNTHTKQLFLPAYTSTTSFTGTAVGILGFTSAGAIVTTTASSAGGSTFPYTGTAGVTGSISATGPIYSQANGTMYFRGGDDAEFWDINLANHVGIYGQQDATVGSIKLGSGGGIISGKSSNIGIGTTNPTSASLTVDTNVWAKSFTGSLSGNVAGTASWANNATSASFAATASNIANAITGNVDNRVLTATGGSTISGEASLTFDGSILDVTGGTLTVGSEGTYAARFRNGVGNKPITIGSDSTFTYIQSWGSAPLFLNNQGNYIYLGGSMGANSGLTNASSRPAVGAGTLGTGEIRGYSNTSTGADDGFLRLSAGGGNAGNVKSYIDLSGYSTVSDMDRNVVIGTSGVERMRLDTSGNLGIATANPSARLDVNGGDGTPYGEQFAAVIKGAGTGNRTMYFDGATEASVWWGTGNTPQFAIDSSAGGGSTFWTHAGGSWSERMRLTSAGLLGINTSTPSATLTVNGITHITGSLLVSGSSMSAIYGGYKLYGGGILYDSTLLPSVDTDGRALYYTDGATIAVEWANTALYDGSGVGSLDWGARKLTDSTGAGSINYSSRYLLDSGENVSVDYGNWQLSDGSQIAADWSGRSLYDGIASESINWDARRLFNAAGTTHLSWGGSSGAILTGTSSWANNATNAGNATAIDVSSFGSNVESYLLMSNIIATTGVGVGGDSDLRYNASTNRLSATHITATSVTGSLLGNVAGTASWASNVVGGIGVTSVGGTGTVNGITLTGTVTSTGNLTLGGTLSGIGNSQLTNSSITIAGTSTALGSSIAQSTILAGSGVFSGSAQITGLTNSNLSGTAGITNANLANSSVTVGSTAISLGSSATTIAGLASLTSTNLTGSLLGNVAGTASWATNATTAVSASTRLMTTNADHYLVFVDANNATATSEALGTVGGLTYNPSIGLLGVSKIGSLSQISGSVVLSGSLETTGSFRGNVTALSIASSTASVNLALGNMFTVTLANNTTTHFAFTNIRPGQTANIRVTQGASGNGVVSFQSVAKQPSGSAYTGSQVANAIDIVSLVTFDSTDVYVNSVRRLI